MNKEFTSNDIRSMQEESCNHSDMGAEGECPDCGYEELENKQVEHPSFFGENYKVELSLLDKFILIFKMKYIAGNLIWCKFKGKVLVLGLTEDK